MSYDVYLRRGPLPACAHCGRGPDEGGESLHVFNLTFNVSSIVEACLIAAGAPTPRIEIPRNDVWSWWRLAGWTGRDAVLIVDKALKHLDAHATDLEALDAPNGWGCVEDVRRVFVQLYNACERSPNHTIEVSG